ncbi:MAG TPA: flavodoxin [bacterium]|nr:flavodoxin domain-containing protein [bacterium]HDP98664.1 flavodoxin [bacterium]
MKTLLVYTTRHGCAEKCAREIEKGLRGEVKLVNLKKEKLNTFTDYDTVIVGGSIHAGKIQKKISDFCQKNLDTLKVKKLGLYLCCMEEGEKAQQQFDNAFPTDLIEHATATAIMGGEFDFERMNFLERAIIRKIAQVDHSISKVSPEQIAAFIEKINN